MALGSFDGAPDTEGFMEGTELGEALVVGDPEGNEDGWPDRLGCADGVPLG